MIESPPEIATQLSGVCAAIHQQLGTNLRAIHLYGSAVDSGLKPNSDIDLMVAVAEPLMDATRHQLMRELLRHSAWPGSSTTLRALEVTVVALSELVPWRYPPTREMQFGEWLREDIRAGRLEPAMPDHDLAILMTKLRLHSRPLHGPEAAELFDRVPTSDFRRSLRDTIAQWNEEQDWHGDERNVLLALARIWFSACTGAIASKDAAAAWACGRLPPEYGALMTRAAAAYLSGQKDGLDQTPGPLASTIQFCKAEIEQALQNKSD